MVDLIHLIIKSRFKEKSDALNFHQYGILKKSILYAILSYFIRDCDLLFSHIHQNILLIVIKLLCKEKKIIELNLIFNINAFKNNAFEGL